MSTGFFIGPNIVLTSAHGLQGAKKAIILPSSGGIYEGDVHAEHHIVSGDNVNEDFGIVILPKKITKKFFELVLFPIGEALHLKAAGFSSDKEGLWSQTFVVRGKRHAVAFAYAQPGMSVTPCFSGNKVYGLVRGVCANKRGDTPIVKRMVVTRVTPSMLKWINERVTL